MNIYTLTGVVSVSCSATIEAYSEEEAIQDFINGEFITDSDGEPTDVICNLEEEGVDE